MKKELKNVALLVKSTLGARLPLGRFVYLFFREDKDCGSFTVEDKATGMRLKISNENVRMIVDGGLNIS